METVEEKFIRVKHFCNLGDAIASLAGLKKYYEITGKKIIFCQQINIAASYYEGATHPTLSDGVQVMMNNRMLEMVTPLLLAQEYIAGVEIYNGQKIDIDLDVIRSKVFVNIPHQAIQQWIFMAYPDLAADLSKAWISVNKNEVDVSDCKLCYTNLPATEFPVGDFKDKVIVNFTERYRNHTINYYFLKKYQDRLIFAGTENEKKIFCDKWELDIPYLKVNNFLQLTTIIKESKFLLSNQSMAWNIAESIKSKRILELCQYAANCQSFIGEDSYGFYHQVGVEYYVEKLMNKI